MLSKLALRNVSKSYRDFSVYFITLTFSVALFYIFNSFDQQSTILELRQGQGTMIQSMVMVMDVMSVIVAGVFAFLILYANNFLIKRRKKELGLYALLGMERHHISGVLIFETIIIGVVSLAAGLILGVVFSQLTSVFTARLLAVNVNYGFVFSLSALVKTVAIFLIVFAVVALFNQRMLRKHTLIELLKSDRSNEETVVKGGWVSFIVFIVGTALLIGAYAWALMPMQLILMMLPIVGLGTVATFLVFKSLAGFMLRFMRSNKPLYYKNLNAFVFRQVTSKINSTYRVMATISLMLLVGMGTLITGFNLNTLMGNQVKEMIAFDYTASVFDASVREETDAILDQIEDIQRFAAMTTYSSVAEEGLRVRDIANVGDDFPTAFFRIRIVGLEEFNQFRAMKGLSPLSMNDGEATLYSRTVSVITSEMEEAVANLPKYMEEHNLPLTIFGTDYAYKHTDNSEVRIENASSSKDNLLVMTDSDLNSLFESGNIEFVDTAYAVDGVKGHDSDALSKEVKTRFDDAGIPFEGTGSQEGLDTSKGLELIFTYIALYLGIVFLLTSGVILALQQLSEANDNQKRYTILLKMGVDEGMMKGSVMKQNLIYFVVPLIVALIHTFVGIKAVNMNLDMGGLAPTSIIPTLIVMAVMLSMYSVYFWIAYSGSKRILNLK